MSASVLLVLLLSFFLSTTASAPAPANNLTLTLLLNDCCGPTQSYFLRTLSLPDPALNVSLNLNITTSDPQSTVVYTQQWNDPWDDNVDGLTADPTAANPTFLTAHGDFKLIQYIQSPLNATAAASAYRPNPAPHVSNMMPYPQSDVPGVGLYYVELHHLFYLDLLNSYYAISFIDVEGSTTDFDFMVFTAPDVYEGGVTAARPTYTDNRKVPSDTYPGLSGSRAAIDQERALVYVNVVFWQAPEPQYTGWLWTFDPQKNSIVSQVPYPLNSTGDYDFKTELVWSKQRQTLYGATFPEDDSMQLDTINPTNGTVVRLGSYDAVVMDNYDSCQSLDDESGWWWFATNDPYAVPSYGLVWLLYSVNVDTGARGPAHTLNTPYFVLGFSSLTPPPPVVAMTAALTAEQVQANEKETAAQRQRAKRLESKKKSRKVSLPSVLQQ